jgi:hypothetical protein
MKLDPVGEALRRVTDGSTAASLETETLDFKRDPHTVTGHGLGHSGQRRALVLVTAGSRGRLQLRELRARELAPRPACALGRQRLPAPGRQHQSP